MKASTFHTHTHHTHTYTYTHRFHLTSPVMGICSVFDVKTTVPPLQSTTDCIVIKQSAVDCLMTIAYFIGNISANISKSIYVCQSYSKSKVGRFLRHSV